jgi:serine/threonine protein kinase
VIKESSSASEDTLTPEERRQFDDACDAFETEWREHAWPRLEDYLDGCSEPLRSVLSQELFKIDAHWRTQATDVEKFREKVAERLPTKDRALEFAFGGEPHEIHPRRLQLASLGPFRALEKIGDGGFGIVFRAWDTRHQRSVALKVPRFGHQLSGRELDQFLREAKAAGSLDHPNIARVWDSGTAAGVAYIAYQLIEGENLKVRFQEINKQSPLQIADLVRRLAVAVQYAHDRGIIHRDVKPSNILLRSDDQPVLTDFGLALATGGEATRSLAGRIGTLDYMSPEQAMAAQHEIDQRSDLWSLGVVMYELLTGELPFHGATDIQLCSNICNVEHRRLRTLRREIPKDLEVIVDRCLQKRPADRLASCGELAAELERVESGKPILSRRVSFVERALRWCRRNPKPLTAFGIILLATIFGSWSWGLRLAESRQNENVVQQLQLQIEVKNAERRELLTELMRTDPTKLQLLRQDLDFLEGRLFATTNRQERLFCAEVLLRNNLLQPERYERDDSRREIVVAAMHDLLAGEIDSGLKSKLQSALKPLDQHRENVEPLAIP